MEITGKVYELTPTEKGVTKNGKAWYKRTLVIQTVDDYPKNIAVTVFGEDKCKSVDNLKFGDLLTAKISLNSRKYANRWFSEISCLSIGAFQRIGQQVSSLSQPQQAYSHANIPQQLAEQYPTEQTQPPRQQPNLTPQQQQVYSQANGYIQQSIVGQLQEECVEEDGDLPF